MSNKRIYELNGYEGDKFNDYSTIIDSENVKEAMKVPLSTFAMSADVGNKFDDLNNSARKIVSDINYVKSNITTIQTGTTNNIEVNYDTSKKEYSFATSSYDLKSVSNDVLDIKRSESNGNVTFTLSANTHNKAYIDDELSKLNNNYDVSGLNNIVVSREKDKYNNDTNRFHIYLDGITAVDEHDDDKNDVNDYSVAINGGKAFDYSFVQGYNNYASSCAFAQGKYNKSKEYSLAQGYGNNAINHSISQGVYNTAENFSFAQGQDTVGKDYSFALGFNTHGINSSFALGYWVSAIDNSVGFGFVSDKHVVASNHSMLIGDGRCSASNHSINFYGDVVEDYSFNFGHNGLVKNQTTAFGNYNDPKLVSGDNPYTFALGDGTKEKPHTYFWVNRSGVYYSSGENHKIDLTKQNELNTIICGWSEYEAEKDLDENRGKTFIVG